MTILQIEAQNVMALLSLILALMSLISGCVYIFLFSTVHTRRKVGKWAGVAFFS